MKRLSRADRFKDGLRVTRCLLLAMLCFSGIIVSAHAGGKKVIVLGIDGMDPELFDQYVKEGRMPNAAILMKDGVFSRLRTSDPPQSPVAWANFISGCNPGGHGIYDFIARDPVTVEPYLSAAAIGGKPYVVSVGAYEIPLTGRKAVNLRRGPTFWAELQRAGIDCTVIRIPDNFPPTECGAKSLSGMGTPDIHGSYGIFTFYTDKAGESSRDIPGGRVEHVMVRDGVVDCVLPGPVNTLRRGAGNVNVAFKVFVDESSPAVLVSIQNREFILNQGEWSDWQEVSFPMMSRLVSVSGICRFYLKKSRKDFALYVSPVNIDPANPSLPISTPANYARQLASRVGRFYTQGMAEDTKALSAGVLDEGEYRQQATRILTDSLRMYESELDGFTEGFFFYYFSALDLNSHVFWRTVDSDHPVYSADIARKHGDFLPWLYSRMDHAIGMAMKRLEGDSVLIVMSDHGFTSFRRQFNLNTWLMDNGYAVAVPAASRGSAGYFADADWTQTRAYGLGINGLYLNIRGREKHGIVTPGPEQEALTKELISRLKAVKDPKTGENPILNVLRPAEIYSGLFTGAAPDLVVCYNRNYRASWDTVLGKYPEEVFADNTDPWSGDHAIDASLVPGVLLTNRKIKVSDPALYDIAPTILAEFGVPVPKEMIGRNLFQSGADPWTKHEN